VDDGDSPVRFRFPLLPPVTSPRVYGEGKYACRPVSRLDVIEDAAMSSWELLLQQ
jgi:hypothetical protein